MEKKDSSILKFLLIFVFFQSIVFNPWGEEVFILSKFLFSFLVIFIAFLLFLLKKTEEEKIFFKVSLLDIPVLIYFISLVISTVFSVHTTTSMKEFLLNLNYIVYYFIAVNYLKGVDEIKKILYFIFSVSFLISIYSILQKLKIDFFLWSQPVYLRPASTLGNPNFLAAYLCIVLPLMVSRIVLKEERFSRVFIHFLISAVVFSSLLLTYTRGGWLSFAISIFLLVYLKRNSIDRKKFLTSILFFLIIFYFLNYFERIPIENREFNLFERATSVSDSVFVRLNLWKDSLFLFRKYFFIGSGLNTYPLVYPEFRNVEILRIQAITALPEDAHNYFLQTAVTSGIFGFLSYLFLISTFFYKLFKINKSENNWIFAGLFSSFIAYLIQSIFNPVIPDTKLLFFGIITFTGIYAKRRDISLNYRFSFNFKIFLYISLSLLLISFALPYISRNFVGDYHFKKGKYYEMRQEFYNAFLHYSTAIENVPDNPVYHRQLGFILRKMAEFEGIPENLKKFFLRESIKKYKTAILLNSYDASLYADLAKVYSIYAEKFDKKFYKNAIKCYEIALKKDYNYSIFHNDFGILYLNMKEYRNAEKEFKISIRLTPNFIEPYINLGILYYREKNYKKAIQISKEAMKNNLETEQLYANLAIFYKEIKEYNKAKRMVEKAIKLNPENSYLKLLLKEIEEKWKKN